MHGLCKYLVKRIQKQFKVLIMSILRYFMVAIFLCISINCKSQTPKTPLSRVINVPGTSQIAPSLSGDGQHMIFTTTSNLKGELLLFYAYQQSPGKWTQPEPVTVVNRSLPINHIGGYSLSYDGNYIFFTSRKSYGIGKFDIWYCRRSGDNQWTTPVNLAKPVNSTQDDGCPSLSPDGNTLYFVRCESMDLKEGTGCRLMVSERRNQDLWGEPEPLPDYINDGNIMSPRILVDNQTLIYAKGQGNKWDLYQSTRVSGSWTKPVPLAYVNTPADERFASIPAQGDIIYYSTRFKDNYEIIKARIPQDMQPNKVVYMKGQITDVQGSSMEAFIQVYDLEQKKLEQYHRTGQTSSDFELYLPAGKKYDFSVVPLSSGYAFYSEIFDLKELTVSTRRRVNITLDNLDAGASFPLHCVEFDNDSTLSKSSKFEMSRIIKLLKNNPGTKLEIAVHRETLEPDTLLLQDSLSVTGVTPQDTTALTEQLMLTESSLDSIDSLQTEGVPVSPPLDVTEIQARAISKYLEERGVPEYVVEVKGYADSEPLDTDDPNADPLVNRRVELKVL